MARQEADREDLMAEATALRRRAEIEWSGSDLPVIFGYRERDYLSLYLSPDLVYHFDDQMRIRRAFLEGILFRSEGHTLARLTRVREAGISELHRSDLNAQELQQFFNALKQQMTALQHALENGDYKLLRQIPEEDDDLVVSLQESLSACLQQDPKLSPGLK